MMWGNDSWIGWASGMENGEIIMVLVFWTSIIGGVFMLYRWLSGRNKTKFSNGLTTPIDILQRRCAREKSTEMRLVD